MTVPQTSPLVGEVARAKRVTEGQITAKSTGGRGNPPLRLDRQPPICHSKRSEGSQTMQRTAHREPDLFQKVQNNQQSVRRDQKTNKATPRLEKRRGVVLLQIVNYFVSAGASSFSLAFSSTFSSFFLWNKILSTGKYRKNCNAEQTAVAMFLAAASDQPMSLRIQP